MLLMVFLIREPIKKADEAKLEKLLNYANKVSTFWVQTNKFAQNTFSSKA